MRYTYKQVKDRIDEATVDLVKRHQRRLTALFSVGLILGIIVGYTAHLVLVLLKIV